MAVRRWREGDRFRIDADIDGRRVCTEGTVGEDQRKYAKVIYVTLDYFCGMGNVGQLVHIKDLKPID